MNQYKACFFRNPNQLHLHRLAVTERQLTQFWYNKTLVELQKILSIKDQYLIYNIIFEQYIKYFYNTKRISPGEIYHVMFKQQILTYVYDAKIFRNPTYEKYDNDMLSTFLIAYKEKEETINDEVHQFLDYNIFKEGEWILKVKQSAILRIFPFLIHRFLQKRQSNYESTVKNPIGGYYMSKDPNIYKQVVILDPSVYYYYIYSLIPKYQLGIQLQIKSVFQLITQLMYNNLLMAWYSQLSQQQKYQRHFKRYFRLIQKPRNKQQFTSIDDKFTQIKWQTFKINIFKLKYLIKQNENYYQCYQVDLKNELLLNVPYEDLSIDDENILKAFDKQKKSSPNYDQDYTNFFQNNQQQ